MIRITVDAMKDPIRPEPNHEWPLAVSAWAVVTMVLFAISLGLVIGANYLYKAGYVPEFWVPFLQFVFNWGLGGLMVISIAGVTASVGRWVVSIIGGVRS